jgi:catechol 2,3-dioxygenase
MGGATDGAGWGIPAPAHRLPPGLRLGAVRLQVADLTRSLAWYGRVLGMRVIDRAEGSARLGAAGGHAPLVELRERRGAAPVPRNGRLGLFHFALLLPDRPALGRFVAHLRAQRVAAGAADHLVSEALYLSDPDGLGIEVYADRPRAMWQADAGQLRMDTLPLDLTELVAVARAEPWDGMPAGTTMGHVHLHVGDLAVADAFYHEALGFDRTVWGYPGALFLSAGGYHHHLGVNTWAAGAPPAAEDEARLIEWELLLPDAASLRAAADSLAAARHALDVEDNSVVVRDPWGTAVRLRS